MFEFAETSGLSARPASPEYLLASGNGIPVSAGTLTRMLDVIDYAILMMKGECEVVFANQIARAELDEQHPLQLQGHKLQVRHARDGASLRQALASATRRGTQSMLKLRGAPGEDINVAVVPIADPDQPPAVLLLCGKRRACEELSADAFARHHDLTLAETRVLKLLCAGHRPAGIALAFGVKLTTVRTQVCSIRAKTGSRDVGGLVQQVSRLPPLPCMTRRAV